MEPLASIRVLDLTRVRSGPAAVRQLADWGADVIKVEQPGQDDVDPFGGGERHSPDFQNLHRNKRSLTLNLKTPEGVAILKRLVQSADVMLENYRPEVKWRLGIDYPAMREVNKRLVYASISGFGEDGPYRDRPGFDQIAQGMGGFMSVTGLPGQGPVRAGIPIADLSAGLLCAQGVLLALIERQTSGEGQWVTTSLLAAQIFMLDFQASRWLNAGEVPIQAGNNHPLYIPTGAFKTADGHINIGASGQMMWERLAPALGAPELLADPRYTTADKRSENRDALTAEIEKRLASAGSATWIERLNAAGVPCGRIYSVDEVFADPQVEHLKMVDAIESPYYHPLRVVAQAVRLSRTPHELRRRPPEPGEHTDEILGSLGLAPAEIADLRGRENRVSKILSATSGSSGTLTFNNPERHNAMSLDMWRAATAVLEQFEQDPAVRVIVLTGAGGKAFVSGADISKFESERATVDAVLEYNAAVDRFSQALEECSKPTIAMIRGYCVGGGVGIAVCCDLRITNDAARFAVPAAKLGLGYGYANVRRIMDLVGPQYTTEMLLTARQFDSVKAVQAGLVNHVIPDTEIESYVRDLAETIAGNAPLTIRAVKRIVRELRRDEPEIAACDALVKQCFESADYREGRKAFMEKRKPIFRGV